MKKLILSLCFLGALQAQTPSSFPYSKPLPNDASTGTTQFTLTSINSSGNAVIMAHTATAGYTGVAVSNAGTTGSVWVAFAGLVPVKMDATATAGHYVTISSTTDGLGHDTGASTYPTSGLVAGLVQAGCTGANCLAMVDVFGAEVHASSSTSSVQIVDIMHSAGAIGTGATTTYLSLTGIGNFSPTTLLGTDYEAQSQNIGDAMGAHFIYPGGTVTDVSVVVDGWAAASNANSLLFNWQLGCDHVGSANASGSLNTATASNSAASVTANQTYKFKAAALTTTGCSAGDLAFLKGVRAGTLPNGQVFWFHNVLAYITVTGLTAP